MKLVYGLDPAFIIDNRKSRYSQIVRDVAFLEELDAKEYVLVLASNNPEIYSEIKTIASKYFETDKIFELESMKNIDTKDFGTWETQIGKWSYGPICRKHMWIKSIGSFCSFAEGVEVVNNHELRYVTTHPIIYEGKQFEEREYPFNMMPNVEWCMSGIEPKYDKVKKQKRSVIGNDVLLGKNVIITNGANIGNGVIAAAGAVITKDVPDYAVVAGVPARIIKFRYTPEQIEALNKIAWWDWTDEEIRKRHDDMYLPIEQFIEKYL